MKLTQARLLEVIESDLKTEIAESKYHMGIYKHVIKHLFNKDKDFPKLPHNQIIEQVQAHYETIHAYVQKELKLRSFPGDDITIDIEGKMYWVNKSDLTPIPDELAEQYRHR
jgi:hypothetical protein